MRLPFDREEDLTALTGSAVRTTSFPYDGDFPTSAANTDGDALLYTYDKNGRLATVQNFNGEIYVQNEYDGQRRVIKRYVKDDGAYAGSYTTEYTYSGLDMVTHINYKRTKWAPVSWTVAPRNGELHVIEIWK